VIVFGHEARDETYDADAPCQSCGGLVRRCVSIEKRLSFMRDVSRKRLLAGIVFTIAVLVYHGAFALDFVRFDDPIFVTQNVDVRDGVTWRGLKNALTTPMCFGNWVPLTIVSHMVDVELFGVDPMGHHATSVALHALTAALLFVAWRSVRSEGEALFVGLSFAVHPCNVESVAWIAARRDTLCGVFFSLAIMLWLDARVRRRASGRILVLVAGVCAMLSKSTAVTLPAVLLILDCWPLGRRAEGYARLFVEKLPLFAAVFCVCAVTYAWQMPTALAASPLSFRLPGALVGYAHYLTSFFIPGALVVLTPRPATWSVSEVAVAAGMVLAATIIGVLAVVWRRCLAVIAGGLWFFGMLVPMIGIVQVGPQAYADRYTYLPFIGLAIAAAGALHCAVDGRFARRCATVVVSVVWLAWLLWRSIEQVPVWRNTRSLFAHAIDAGVPSALAHEALGNDFAAVGDYAAALPHLREAVRIATSTSTSELEGLGFALLRVGDAAGAQAAFTEAVRRDGAQSAPRHGLGLALGALGNDADALNQLRLAHALGGENVATRVDLARALAYAGARDEAFVHLDAVGSSGAARASDLFAAGAVALGLGEVARASSIWEAATRRFPNAVEPWRALAWLRCASPGMRDGSASTTAVVALTALIGRTPLGDALAACAARARDGHDVDESDVTSLRNAVLGAPTRVRR
jgi:tetratricopeptide (TPR) repeat protein